MIRQLKPGRPAAARAELDAQVRATVEEILGAIERRGDAALRDHSERFDHWAPEDLRLSPAKIQAGIDSLSPQAIADIESVAGLDRVWRDEQAARTPLQRLARTEEVAVAVLALATQLTLTTGAVIPVDGARPLA